MSWESINLEGHKFFLCFILLKLIYILLDNVSRIQRNQHIPNSEEGELQNICINMLPVEGKNWLNPFRFILNYIRAALTGALYVFFVLWI